MVATLSWSPGDDLPTCAAVWGESTVSAPGTPAQHFFSPAVLYRLMQVFPGQNLQTEPTNLLKTHPSTLHLPYNYNNCELDIALLQHPSHTSLHNFSLSLPSSLPPPATSCLNVISLFFVFVFIDNENCRTEHIFEVSADHIQTRWWHQIMIRESLMDISLRPHIWLINENSQIF